MMQKFIARERFDFPNGATGYRPGGFFDCLGPWAKVSNCPIYGFESLRLTAYATGYADTFFSIPACTRFRGQYVGGFFSQDDSGAVFRPYDRFTPRLFKPADSRYTLSLEYCGEEYPRLILRFCGEWVGKVKTIDEAKEAMK